MSLSQSSLSSGLSGLSPAAAEATAISNLMSAWNSYFAGASVSGVAIGDFSAASSSMQGALTGMSAPGAAAAVIAAALVAFWTALAPLGPSLWILAPNVITPPLTPPPTLGAIAAGLTAVFAANTAPGVTLSQAANAIAGVLHASGGIGGIAIVQPPGPVPPVPTPIL